MTNDVKQQVRAFLLDNFLMGGDRERIADTDSFMERRLLDSTGFIELVTFVEQQFEIRVADDEMLPENLDSLERIAAYVHRKRPE
jgi:acyl carrier protein